MRLTEQVHHHLKSILTKGDIAVDATTGNGHDTLFLAQCIGDDGEIFAFDVQEQALISANALLQREQTNTQIRWIHAGHEQMLQYIPPQLHQHIKAITFNLGYLPHTDKSITTSPDTTLPALTAAASILAKGGVLSILAYTGHSGGREEAEAVKAWAATLDGYKVSIHIPENTKFSPPEWICVTKI